MNLNELKETARTGSVMNPLAVKECLYRLGGCRIIDLVGEPESLGKLLGMKAGEYSELDMLTPLEKSEKLNEISESVTLDFIIDLIAKTCGGNLLCPYLKFLNIESEKFSDFSFPKDVQHSVKPNGDNWEIWARGAPCAEPEYFTDYEEEQVVYSESLAVSDSECGFTPTYFEAPAAPLPCMESPRKEPFLAALENADTFKTLNDILRSLLFITV